MRSKDRAGYGWLGINHVGHYAHRVAYMLARGPILEGLFVLHSCDNPACVNPDHLRVGTQVENMRDRVQRNRVPDKTPGALGEKNMQAKLTSQQVKSIRTLLAMQEKKAAIARRFSVAPSTVSRISSNHKWRHLP